MKKHNLKKTAILIISALTLAAVALVTLCACTESTPTQTELAESCIRIHIRANSNSEDDQTVKLAVRDEITAYLQTALANCKDKSDAASVLSRESNNLVRIANTTLATNGFDYKSSIRIDNEYFPDRVYEDYTFPAGNYDAVVINLGSGSGDNWWCVAFPPLCFVPNTGGGEKIVYKSWIKETLDKLFKK